MTDSVSLAPLVFKRRPIRALIDCSAFRHNIQKAQELAENSNILVVIKADAYGHGLLEMARAAGKHSVLAVATSDEALVLVEAGIPNSIWVLEGPFGHDCIALSERHPVEWVVHSFWQLSLLEKPSSSTTHKIWLKIDTGMHRLGFPVNDIGEAVKQIARQNHLQLAGCMSHFSSSDLPESASVGAQIKLFDQALDIHSLSDLPQSLSNSGGVFFYPEAHRSWVRPGIMLYGAMPGDKQRSQNFGLRPAMTFESAIMSLRRISAGEAVGYGAAWVAERDSLIATVSGGYGDGYPRHAPNGTPLAVSGQIVPLVGRVSMDMLAIDVTDMEQVKLGDAVEFWGEQVPVEQVAELSGTISYELLTGITSRVPRIYL